MARKYSRLTGVICTGRGVITDGHITMACGVGFAIDMGREPAKAPQQRIFTKYIKFI